MTAKPLCRHFVLDTKSRINALKGKLWIPHQVRHDGNVCITSREEHHFPALGSTTVTGSDEGP